MLWLFESIAGGGHNHGHTHDISNEHHNVATVTSKNNLKRIKPISSPKPKHMHNNTSDHVMSHDQYNLDIITPDSDHNSNSNRQLHINQTTTRIKRINLSFKLFFSNLKSNIQ